MNGGREFSTQAGQEDMSWYDSTEPFGNIAFFSMMVLVVSEG